MACSEVLSSFNNSYHSGKGDLINKVNSEIVFLVSVLMMYRTISFPIAPVAPIIHTFFKLLSIIIINAQNKKSR